MAMNEHLHIYKKTGSQTASKPKQSQFQSRPFVVQAQTDSNEPLAETERENQAFQQQKLEATRLEIQAKQGTITPEGQKRLTVLQTKRSEFWQQKLDHAERYGHNILNYPRPQGPAKAKTALAVQPKLNIQKADVDQKADTRLRLQPLSRGSLPMSKPLVQPKLTIGEPGDKYEQEADRVAASVVNSFHAPTSQQSESNQAVQRQEEPEAEIQAKPSISDLMRSPVPTQVQREAKPEEEELQAKSILQRREAIGGGEASTDVESAINSARGGGQPLEAGLQRSMGQAMGADFSGVKVHTDAQADRLNQSIQARAFTTGQDVFFRQGEYNPGSRGGQELLAHELTHVVQQSGGRTRLVPTSVVQKASKNQGQQGKPVTTRQIGGADLTWDPSLTGPFYRYCDLYEVDVVNRAKGQYAYKESNKGAGAIWFTTTSEVVSMSEERPFIATLSQIILPSGTSEETVWLNYESHGKLKESDHPSQIIVKNNEPNNYGIGRDIYKASLSNITVKDNPKYKGSTNKKGKKKR
jgi:vacuolar-type H+-ATPase subunit H